MSSIALYNPHEVAVITEMTATYWMYAAMSMIMLFHTFCSFCIVEQDHDENLTDVMKKEPEIKLITELSRRVEKHNNQSHETLEHVLSECTVPVLKRITTKKDVQRVQSLSSVKNKPMYVKAALRTIVRKLANGPGEESLVAGLKRCGAPVFFQARLETSNALQEELNNLLIFCTSPDDERSV